MHDATILLSDADATRARFERVAGLVDGFETPFGLELLATVHWLLRDEPRMDDAALAKAVYAWSERKRQFTREQLRIARQRLELLGWLAN